MLRKTLRLRILLFDDLTHQINHLARFGVTVGLEFGIDQRFVHLDLEPASVRRDQGQVPDVVLELFEQFVCQTHGPVSVVSNSAVDDFDVYHCSPKYFLTERSDCKAVSPRSRGPNGKHSRSVPQLIRGFSTTPFATFERLLDRSGTDFVRKL